MAPVDRQALHETAESEAWQPIALGTTALTMAATDSAAIDWSDLTIPPPTEDSYKTMEAGHMRENMSLAHMLLGGATLGLLAVAGVSGAMLVGQNDPNIRLTHQVAVTTGTLAYLADGSLMLFAPRPYKTKGDTHISNIDYHRYLFYLHLAGMTSAVVTGLIATRFWGLDPSLDIRRTHPAIGATAIGLIGLSATVMALNF
ncbi:MAG TPA: hypothetical protein V6D05_15490 [Stenomitos sp.]